MHTSPTTLTYLVLSLPFALSAPALPSLLIAPINLTEITPSPLNAPSFYGIHLDINVPTPPKNWQGDCRAVGDDVCAELEKVGTSGTGPNGGLEVDTWIWKGGKDETCQAGLYWPGSLPGREGVVKVPSRSECRAFITLPMAIALEKAQGGETRASSNVAEGGWPKEGYVGKAVDERWPRFIVQA